LLINLINGTYCNSPFAGYKNYVPMFPSRKYSHTPFAILLGLHSNNSFYLPFGRPMQRCFIQTLVLSLNDENQSTSVFSGGGGAVPEGEEVL